MDLSLKPVSQNTFNTFGELLKYLRRREHLTQLELSIAVGYSEAQISRLEKNQRLPDLTALRALFIPALHLEDEPQLAARFLELALSARQEDAPTPGIAPYKGLLFFDESDSELFFGREALTAQLVRHVMDLAMDASSRFLAVVGASGSGKSSLVRAGLAVALKRAGWEVGVLTPTAVPLRILQANLDLARIKKAERVLILVDQFEEVFTLCHDELERIAFIDKLLSAAQDQIKKFTVVIALRADFYSHCAQYPLLRQAVATEQEYIGQMTAEELRGAIEEPAKRSGWEFEPGLVDVLLNDIGAQGISEPEPGALPLLSHALLATWEHRRGRVLTLEGYHASGGVRGAIAETAESVYTDQLDHTQQGIAHDIFLRLTELGEGTEDTRRRTSLNELMRQFAEATYLRGVLNILAEARLIILNEDSAEVAHEALIREWQRLHEWLTQDREGLLLHRHLTEAAHEWERRGKDPVELYRGARLAKAREWAATNDGRMNPGEREFLAASIEREEHDLLEREMQRQRELDAAHELAETQKARLEDQQRAASRLRRRAIILTGALFLAIVLAAAALFLGGLAQTHFQRAESERLVSYSRELASNSKVAIPEDPELSILLALRAVEVLQDAGQQVLPEAANALHEAVQASRVKRTLDISTEPVWGLAYSPDGARLATGAVDGLMITIWNSATGQKIMEIEMPENSGLLKLLGFSPDGTRLAGSSTKGDMIFWDAGTGKTIFTLPGNPEAWRFDFSPDGNHLAVAYDNGITRLWDLQNRELLVTIDNGTHLKTLDVEFSPDGKTFVSANGDGIARVYDADNGNELFSLKGHSVHLWAAKFSPDGELIATASTDSTAKIWNATSGELITTLNGHTNEVQDLEFSPDSKVLATAGEDGKIIIWDVATGKQIEKLAGHVGWVTNVTFDPAGNTLASSGTDGTVRIWDWASPPHELLTFEGHTGRVLGFAITPDDKKMVTTSTDETARIWDLSSGQELLKITGGGNSEVYVWAVDVTVSPDGRWFTTIGADGAAGIWDIQTGKQLFDLVGHEGRTWDVAVSPDGTRLATAGDDKTVRVWDPHAGEVLLILRGHTEKVGDVAFSPDGTQLASASEDHTVRIWNSITGALLHTLSSPDSGMFRIVFNKTGTQMVTLDFVPRTDFRIWDTTTGQGLQELKGHTDVLYDAAFSPDGHLIATGGGEAKPIIWDVATGKELFKLFGHYSSVWRLLFSPDGSLLATSSVATVKIWDPKTGQELLTLPGHTNLVTSLAFSKDGKHLFSGSDDGTVREYTLSIDELMSLARSRLTRTWRVEECQKYLHQDTCPVQP
jgi:WD40 repeat protein/transcriptional regulator with XRE-family HTH domain